MPAKGPEQSANRRRRLLQREGAELEESEAPRYRSLEDLPSAIVHLYRAEVGRAVEWRHRLDVTTNWAVITTAAGMTFALGEPSSQRHVVILLTSILISFFLLIEARRYRHYDLWQARVHLLESEVYAPLLDPERCKPSGAWQAALAGDLRSPHYHMSFFEAVGWRLRRNYIWLYLTHLLIWFAKVSIHPAPITSLEQFFERAAVGPIPGWFMIVVGVAFNAMLVAITLIVQRRLRDRPESLRC